MSLTSAKCRMLKSSVAYVFLTLLTNLSIEANSVKTHQSSPVGLI